MEKRLASVLGTSAKHVLTALKRAFHAVAITGFVTAIIVGAGTEVTAYFLTGKTFPPATATHGRRRAGDRLGLRCGDHDCGGRDPARHHQDDRAHR